jgi:hypothetical protein
MFTLSYKIEAITNTDKTRAIVAPVDCRVEAAYIIPSANVADGASNKLVCEVYADNDTDVLFSVDSDAEAGFSLNEPEELALQDGVSKRFEAGQAIQVKCDVTGTIASNDVLFVLKCVPARDI